MNNVTYNSPILLIEGIDVPHRFIYPVFALLLVIYLIILTTNIGVMLLIITDRSLQQPMYLLLFSLSFNDVLGSTAFFGHTYGVSCHTVMMIMAFDRYVAICHPLSVAFTYFRILVSCVSKKNKDLNRKALQTCATHLLLYMIMLWTGFLFIISHRLKIHIMYRMMALIVFNIVPANMNLIVYALQTKELKTKIVQIIHSKVTQLQ
ncbi:hypothetical protein SKAU_G00326430 [Synaphobranchus kaupii]|uniref:G-protein coupled receptors family 1 profile domain-containing protein n=1 Tax=Synaphobranchus kaupii TaxID=118154 RepID=A0A9Q1EPT8_SYNKA|nr:hypothetical protein SKAU_G00326430 [Synaphobranchus kaupii]